MKWNALVKMPRRDSPTPSFEPHIYSSFIKTRLMRWREPPTPPLLIWEVCIIWDPSYVLELWILDANYNQWPLKHMMTLSENLKSIIEQPENSHHSKQSSHQADREFYPQILCISLVCSAMEKLALIHLWSQISSQVMNWRRLLKHYTWGRNGDET